MITQANSSHCAQIEQVMQNAFGPFEHLYPKLAYAKTVVSQDEILKRMTEGITWVAVDKNLVIGTVSIAIEEEWLYVTGMAVDPKAQGKKTGYHLLMAIEKYAQKNGYKQLYLGTTPFLHRAIALYKGIGYYPQENHEREWFGLSTIWFEKMI